MAYERLTNVYNPKTLTRVAPDTPIIEENTRKTKPAPPLRTHVCNKEGRASSYQQLVWNFFLCSGVFVCKTPDVSIVIHVVFGQERHL